MKKSVGNVILNQRKEEADKIKLLKKLK